MRHTGNRLHRIPRQSGRLRGASQAEVVLSTVLAISRSYSGRSSNSAGPQDRYQVLVAMDERCCAILRWGDVLAMWCCNGTLWRIAWHVVVMITSRDTLFRVHEANHFVTS